MEKLQPIIQNGKFRKNLFEKSAWSKKMIICGIDEVGRGCLAGPLVAGAVILPINSECSFLKDSKLMTEKERDAAYLWIIKNCFYSTGIVSHQIIDQYNIWNATLIAMKKAFLQVCKSSIQIPSSIVIDAMPLKLIDTNYKKIPIYHFPKGESWSSSIAAASIVAKVTRDRLMKLIDPIFPNYDFCQNKGYGTKKHKDSITLFGETIIHRKSFLKKDMNKKKDEYKKQQTIF